VRSLARWCSPRMRPICCGYGAAPCAANGVAHRPNRSRFRPPEPGLKDRPPLPASAPGSVTGCETAGSPRRDRGQQFTAITLCGRVKTSQPGVWRHTPSQRTPGTRPVPAAGLVAHPEHQVVRAAATGAAGHSRGLCLKHDRSKRYPAPSRAPTSSDSPGWNQRLEQSYCPSNPLCR